MPQTVEDALHQMSDAAGIIFVGEVTAIRQREEQNGSSGIVEIDFRIDDAIRACTTGNTYTLREWAGLWSADEPRYRVGQRLLMLLHAPGASGISSPVGGMTGVIPIRGTTPAPLGVSAASAATSPMPVIADLRWVGTRLARTISVASSPMVTAADQTNSGNTVGDNSVASQQAPVAVVVKMLRSWQQATP